MNPRSFLLAFPLLLLLPRAACAQGAASPAPQQGERLFILKGCLGCHGASARGGVGPSLAATGLPFDAFLSQLRNPRNLMPQFPPDVVSDDDARSIFEYVRTVAAPPPRLRADLPSGIQDPASCISCHERYNPIIVAQFQSSAMGHAGKQNPRVVYARAQIGCADCHGMDHDKIMASRGRVAEETCGACHAQIYKEHVLDAGHSYGPGPGDLGINWSRNIDVPHYKQMPRKVMEMGCDACHAQAGATDAKYWSDSLQKYIDTSSLPYRNGCIACHTRHSFNLEEARKPEACHTCHMGPDHPNFEAYMESKHGSIYAARGQQWDWTVSMAQAAYNAPTCAYCHMLHVAPDGSRSVTHNMTDKIIWGMGVQAATGQLQDITVQPENVAKRTAMIRTCVICHSEDKASEYLSSADAHKLAGDALVVQAQGILKGLYDDHLLDPSQEARSAGLLPGPHFSAIELPGGVAQHSPTSLYYDVSPIERDYFNLFFFSALKSYKGAFHMAPDYAWWYGYADALGELAGIRSEAQRIRHDHEVLMRTRFMILTGPLMVLAVLAAVYLAWRWRTKRTRQT